MTNFKNEKRLVQALRILAEHRSEIEAFYHVLLQLQVSSQDENQLLIDTFACSVSERRAASRQRGQEAVADFVHNINSLFGQLGQKINDNWGDAHRNLFEGLCKLPNIDQKIAAMFLKFVVVYLDRWPELRPYLFIPVDHVVLKILRDKLQVYSGPWKGSPAVKNAQKKLYVYNGTQPCSQYRRFLEFEEEVGNICTQANVHRILADELWFIGYVFCKELPLCNRCWIRQWCKGHL